MAQSRADSTRETWLATLDKFRYDPDRAATAEMWSPRLDAASRDELNAIQSEKLSAAVPFLYKNSPFYRRRFDRLGLLPSDFRGTDDLQKWPVVDKTEMMADASEHPPYGTYTTTTAAVWANRGWPTRARCWPAPPTIRPTGPTRRRPKRCGRNAAG